MYLHDAEDNVKLLGESTIYVGEAEESINDRTVSKLQKFSELKNTNVSTTKQIKETHKDHIFMISNLARRIPIETNFDIFEKKLNYGIRQELKIQFQLQPFELSRLHRLNLYQNKHRNA